MRIRRESFANFAPSSGPEAVTVGVPTDREGFVWIASPEGLARYDGQRWTPSPDPTLAHSATSLWLERGGTLWAGFRDDGLAHYEGTAWQVENRASGLPSQQIRRFAETHNADDSWTLWALIGDQGLLRRRDGRWQADPRNAQLPRGAVLALAQTQGIGGGERTWLGSGTEGLWYSERGGAWQRYDSDGFDPAQVEYLFATTHAGRQELWILVFGSGLWRLSAESMRRWTRESGKLPTNVAGHRTGRDRDDQRRCRQRDLTHDRRCRRAAAQRRRGAVSREARGALSGLCVCGRRRAASRLSGVARLAGTRPAAHNEKTPR